MAAAVFLRCGGHGPPGQEAPPIPGLALQQASPDHVASIGHQGQGVCPPPERGVRGAGGHAAAADAPPTRWPWGGWEWSLRAPLPSHLRWMGTPPPPPGRARGMVGSIFAECVGWDSSQRTRGSPKERRKFSLLRNEREREQKKNRPPRVFFLFGLSLPVRHRRGGGDAKHARSLSYSICMRTEAQAGACLRACVPWPTGGLVGEGEDRRRHASNPAWGRGH